MLDKLVFGCASEHQKSYQPIVSPSTYQPSATDRLSAVQVWLQCKDSNMTANLRELHTCINFSHVSCQVLKVQIYHKQSSHDVTKYAPGLGALCIVFCTELADGSIPVDWDGPAAAASLAEVDSAAKCNAAGDLTSSVIMWQLIAVSTSSRPCLSGSAAVTVWRSP